MRLQKIEKSKEDAKAEEIKGGKKTEDLLRNRRKRHCKIKGHIKSGQVRTIVVLKAFFSRVQVIISCWVHCMST